MSAWSAAEDAKRRAAQDANGPAYEALTLASVNARDAKRILEGVDDCPSGEPSVPLRIEETLKLIGYAMEDLTKARDLLRARLEKLA